MIDPPAQHKMYEAALDTLMIMAGQGIVRCTAAADTDTEAMETRRDLAVKVARSSLLLGVTSPDLIASSRRVHMIGEQVRMEEALTDDAALDRWLNPNGEQA